MSRYLIVVVAAAVIVLDIHAVTAAVTAVAGASVRVLSAINILHLFAVVADS